MDEIKRNKDYAGQVVDISRSGQRISFKDCLQKMTEKEGDPYLNVFAPQSIYLITLFQFDEKKFCGCKSALTGSATYQNEDPMCRNRNF